jgi:hypothetical protein
MKKSLLLFGALFLLSGGIFAQCTDLFISEYSAGKYNNRAIEIYNPTNVTIALSGYRLSRNDNGTATWYSTEFPAGATIAPYKTYVVVSDKRDTTQYGVALEYPIFDGYEKWDTCRDAAGLPMIDSVTRKAQFCVQVNPANSNLPFRGTKYNDLLDLKCRANGFINPVYNTNRTLYFNGNDAMALFKGEPDLANLTNLIDMVGIYNDITMQTGKSWKDWLGRDLTLDKTLVRKREVKKGTGVVAYSVRDTFRYADWLIFTNNNAAPSFQNLGSHTCDCDPAPPVSSRRTCNGTIILASEDVLPVAFKIFPNPSVSGNIAIEADEKIESIRVIDLMGRVMDNRKMDIQAHTIQLTLQNVHSGIYFIQVTTTDKRVGVRKLIIE